MRCALLSLVLTAALPVLAADPVPSGYRRVAAAQGFPAEVLYAVALAESGRKLASGAVRPWPWTLNVAGRPYRYATRREAFRALEGFLAQGEMLIDIGLMQINWRYHRDTLGTPWQALDPYHNLRVGAALLKRRYRLDGDWWAAIGHYHRPAGGQRAERYRRRVGKRLAALIGRF